MVLSKLDYSIKIRQSYRGHHHCQYHADNDDHLSALLYNKEFQPLHGRSSPNNEQTHNHHMCRFTNSEHCNAVPVDSQLKPVHHFMN